MKNVVSPLKTRRLKAIPWDAWARERSTGMNCEVKLVRPLISQISQKISEERVEETVTVLVVEEADGLLPISGSYFPWVIYKMERECAWSLEVESKLAEIILQREKWNLF